MSKVAQQSRRSRTTLRIAAGRPHVRQTGDGTRGTLMASRIKTIETLEGVGTVSGTGIEGTRARYWLRIRQEIHGFGSEEAPGLYSLTGSIEPLEMDPFLLMNKEDNLTLTIRDGRKLGFFLRHVTIGDTVCEIALSDGMTLLEGL